MVTVLPGASLETIKPRTTVFEKEEIPVTQFKSQLEGLFSELQRRFENIAFELLCASGSPEISFSKEESSSLFKIILEAVDNSLRHSQATIIKTEMILISEDLLQFSISDNGKGFELDNVAESKRHTGIKRMCEYAHKIDARVIFDSNPERGTQVFIAKPITKKRARFYTRLIALF